MKVSFFLIHAKRTKTRQTPIYLRMRYKNDQVTIATGQFITASSWDKKAKRVKGTSAEAKSTNGALKVKIRSAVNQLLLTGKPFNVYTIKDQVLSTSKGAHTLKDAFDVYLAMVKSLIGRDYSPITLIKYQQTFNRIMDFVKIKYNRTTFYLYNLEIISWPISNCT